MTLSAVEKTCAHKDNDIVIHDEVSGVKKVFLSGGSVLRMAKSGYQLNSIFLAFMIYVGVVDERAAGRNERSIDIFGLQANQ